MVEKKRFYVTRAVRHYNKLFTFPKYWMLLLLLLLVSLIGSVITFSMVNPDFKGILDGLVFALQVFFLPTVIIDIVSSETFTKADAVFNLKRNASLSLVICFAWIIMLAVGSISQAFLGFSKALYYTTVFSICVTTAMRFLVLSTVTQLPRSKFILTTISLSLIHI